MYFFFLLIPKRKGKGGKRGRKGSNSQQRTFPLINSVFMCSPIPGYRPDARSCSVNFNVFNKMSILDPFEAPP